MTPIADKIYVPTSVEPLELEDVSVHVASSERNVPEIIEDGDMHLAEKEEIKVKS